MKTSTLTFVALATFGTGLAAPSSSSSPHELDVRGPSGINNRGSALCKKGAMADILNYASKLPDFQLYKDGEHIICSGISSGSGGTCAFFQGTGQNHFGAEVKELLNYLSQHPNTQGCGSIPVSFPPEAGGVNDLSYAGQLTVNYVADTDNPCDPGVCGATDC
ncbi:uncharacterized protein F4807DRAFT_420889 [Annulohypoxylon truncatum]|uniref:uncharacterized protein n=1 Tax=Annulohypoxylon truncatum TaxID=327061 RepID=UPI002007E3DF|nr:uncharacterized protein F4807DRAFT_420889 [Annulohypoxylon truncatum]KAI1210931.1 hypothetical protein F4807DRAFT_420889 [Annulohypoxylon truncatum]